MSGSVEGMRTWRDSKECRWTCRCRKNRTKMEMKIEFSRIERWEVIGECVSVYPKIVELTFSQEPEMDKNWPRHVIFRTLQPSQ